MEDRSSQTPRWRAGHGRTAQEVEFADRAGERAVRARGRAERAEGPVREAHLRAASAQDLSSQRHKGAETVQHEPGLDPPDEAPVRQTTRRRIAAELELAERASERSTVASARAAKATGTAAEAHRRAAEAQERAARAHKDAAEVQRNNLALEERFHGR